MNRKQILFKLTNEIWYPVKQYAFLHLITLIFLTTPILTISAYPITEDSAKVIAEQFFTCKRNIIKSKSSIINNKSGVSCVNKRTASENEEATYYIFNRNESPGFVIISGDDSVPVIIGYSIENSINVDDIPDALAYMLDKYDFYVKDLRIKGKTLSRHSVEPIEPGIPVIEPYLKSKWNQGAPYNWLTPVDNETGEHTFTGCVPTATAQILYYYKWPEKSYTRMYNWNAMRNSYNSGYSDAEGMAVATLMRDLGAIMGTNYTATNQGSGTSFSSISRIPGYTNIAISYSELLDYLDNVPILAAAPTKTSRGIDHAFIIDGLDSNGLFHINWGWGGKSDGYFNIKAEITGTIRFYYMKPDYDNPIVSIFPSGGISTETSTAKDGDTITVTLHNLKLTEDSLFDGQIELGIYYAYQVNRGADGTMVRYPYPQELGHISQQMKWDNSFIGKDVDLELTLLKMPENGNYLIVPEINTNKDIGLFGTLQMFQIADGTLAEVIPFEYQDGNYIFMEIPHEDFDIDISQFVTASTYREGGTSIMQAFVENKGSNDFTGTLTAKIVNSMDVNDVRKINMDLYIAANQSKRMNLKTLFDYTGSYQIKEIEVWKSFYSGGQHSYFKKELDGVEFTILPKDNQAKADDFYGKINIGISWNDGKPYVNDSIYKGEAVLTQFLAYCYDIDNITAHVELWAVPIDTGKARLIKEDDCMIISQNNSHKRYTLYGSTADLDIGSYRIVAFLRCGNNTYVMEQPDVIGGGYSDLEDFIYDNVFHVLDLGIDLPILRLNSLTQTGVFYYQKYNYAEAELENISGVDYCGYKITSDSYYISSSPFRILAGQKAVIYPRIQYKSYNEIDGYMKYVLNNGVRDLFIPIEGAFNVSFTEKPEKLIDPSGIAFYYKNNLSQKPALGFYSKGTIKRSLWKKDEIIATFNDIITDSTYNTYHVCPEGKEIKDIPAGNYVLKCSLTDSNGFEWPTIIIPLIIDEEELPISIEKVEFDTCSCFSYDDEIPVIVTVKNPTQEAISTLLRTEMLKIDLYFDQQELHEVTLSAGQSTTIKLNAHIFSPIFKQDGTFKVYVSACRTKRESGHLDFGESRSSEPIMLPNENTTGIKQREYSKERIPMAYYTIDGKCVNMPTRGLYIIKYNDGKVEKRMK